MLAKLVLAIVCLASLVAAQTAASNTIDPSTISATLRSQWCSSQLNSCGTLCSGSTSANTCDSSTLGYTCTCNNGSSPGLQYYTDTMPTFICEQVYRNCILAGANDQAAQQVCTQDEKTDCGHLDVSKFTAPVATTSASSSRRSSTSSSTITSSSASSSATQFSSSTSTSGTNSQTPTSSSSSSISSSNAASASQTAAPDSKTGLSTGAKAGIGIGAAIGGLLVIGLIAFFFYRKGKRDATKRPARPNAAELGGESWNRAEMGDDLTPAEKAELKSRRRAAELAGSDTYVGNMAEMGDGQGMIRERAELEALRKQAFEQRHEVE